MTTRARSIGLTAAVFAVVGLGIGIVGYVGTDWATGLFYLEAGGQQAAQFGPIFVALVAFQVALVTFLVGPLIATLMGVLVGSQQHVRQEAVMVTSSGALLGFLLMCIVAVPIASLGVGAGIQQPFSVTGFVLRLAIASIPTTIAGALAGVAGVEFMS